MNIPESDHQIVANLIAFAALVITAIIAIATIRQNTTTRKIALYANSHSKKANQIAEKALKNSEYELEAQLIPNFSVALSILVAEKSEPENDFVLLQITNDSTAKVTIDEVNLIGNFEIEIYYNATLPKKIAYHNTLDIKLKIRENSRKAMEEQSREIDDVNDPTDVIYFFNVVEKQSKAMIITVRATNELDIKYIIRCQYDSIEKRFASNTIESS